jgi:glycosyltransferase involved in cell wall biosynthesis
MRRLTVVTPTLNQGQYIESTIASVLRELGPADSYVVVDGGSTDSTQEILRRYAHRLSAVYVRPGMSQAEALDFGFRHHPGTYAAYLNSDDLWLPGVISSALGQLEADPSLAFVYSDRVFIDDSDRVIDVWKLPKHSTYLMQRWDYVPQETCFWRYATMMEVGGIDENLKFAVDYDLFVRLMRAGRAQHLSRFNAAFRVHGHSKTSTQNDSVGKPEVAMLKKRHAIRAYPWDRPVGFLLRTVVEVRSRRYLDVHENSLLQQLVDVACDRGGQGRTA